MSLLLLTPLFLFSIVYSKYKQVKRSAILSYTLLALIPVLLIGLWYILSPRNANAIDINPYHVLDLAKDATLIEIKQKYRQLSRKYHPDVVRTSAEEGSTNSMGSNNNAVEYYKKINLAKEILTNPEKRKNYDEHGNPNGREWWDDEYPDWIVRPNGKALFITYSSIASVVIFIPLAIVYLIPALKEPPLFVRNHFFNKLHHIESEYLEKGMNEEAYSSFMDLQIEWSSVESKFKYWSKSDWYTILCFAIQSRVALCEVTLMNFDRVNEFLNEFKRVHKDNYKKKHVMDALKPYCDDLVHEIDFILKNSSITKVGKWKQLRKAIVSISQ